MAENIPHVQARFFTKQSKYAVPAAPLSVPATVTTKELCAIINSLLQETVNDESSIEFDFLIDGEFLRVALDKHLEDKNISTELTVDIEYVERHPAPKPEDTLQHDDWVSCISGSNKWILTGCYDNTIHLWTTDGKSLMTIPGHAAPVKSVRWIDFENDSDCTFISGSHDQLIYIWQWNQETNEVDCLQACRGHAGSVDCLAISANKEQFCSGSWDRMLKLWSTSKFSTQDDQENDDEDDRPSKKKKTGKKIPSRVPILTLSGHTEAISGVQWLDTNEVCTASWDHTLKLWDLNSAKEKSHLQGSKVFLDLSYSNLNRQIITASADRHVRLWDPRTCDGALVKCTYTSHSGWVSSVSWSPDNEYLFISGSYDTVMKLWDTRSPKVPLYNMTGHEEKILAVDWSLPQLMLSGGADNHLKIFQYN